MKNYLVLFLLGVLTLCACNEKRVGPGCLPPDADPTQTVVDVAAASSRCELPITLDKGWWFKSIEVGFNLGRYGDAKKIVYPNTDMIKLDWATIVRKSATQVEVLVDSNATDRSRVVALYLQSYQGEQSFHVRQNSNL